MVFVIFVLYIYNIYYIYIFFLFIITVFGGVHCLNVGTIVSFDSVLESHLNEPHLYSVHDYSPSLSVSFFCWPFFFCALPLENSFYYLIAIRKAYLTNFAR